jgi:predicted double-glycine peptidase
MGALSPWVLAVGVAALAAAGVAGAWRVSGRKWWPAASALAVVLIAAFGAGRWVPWLELVAPFKWVMRGRLEYALFAPAAAVALVPLLRRLPQRRQAITVGLLLVVLVGQYSLVPFLLPALMQRRLAALKTKLDPDGVCRQTTAFTCGPAASVTALRRLGIDATEAELAGAMSTSPALGTPTDVLALSLAEHYAPLGLTCEYRRFASVDELPRDRPVLAVVKFQWMVDHFVAVLAVDDCTVTVGDPAAGKVVYTREQFERKWRFVGVVLTRAAADEKMHVADTNSALTGS